eukprot:CAMPEP_0113599478 /NCGR_PEP_ID=MMETSP0015_2-20120614/42165_1 /TAXON_ID=2838 /ORGANISM="Odontella" /LENGTH=71 /DNA_ID=CAMNT_0000507611 /DNA_START=1 /DNA_END=213 /DNA_ORIENTATION=+ /assembly_acc=CAM_ASM_000160
MVTSTPGVVAIVLNTNDWAVFSSIVVADSSMVEEIPGRRMYMAVLSSLYDGTSSTSVSSPSTAPSAVGGTE